MDQLVRPNARRLLVLSLLAQSLASCNSGGPPAAGLGRGTPDVIGLGASTDGGSLVRGCFENGSPREFGTLVVSALSPDGEHFVSGSQDGLRADVVSTLDASTQHLAGGGIDHGGARWAPSGQRLAYVSNGIPYVADGDGANARSIEVSFPGPPAGYSPGSPDQIAWAEDLAHVAFVIHGMAVLANVQTMQGQVVSNKLVVGIAFSPDGAKLAIGQQFLNTGFYPEGTTLVVDSETLESQEIGSSIGRPAWSAAGNWLVQGYALISLSSGQTVGLDSSPALSPDRTEFVLMTRDGSLHVRSFDGAEDRVLLSAVAGGAGYLTWTPDGSGIWYIDGSGLQVVRASDGAALLSATGGTWGPGYGLMFGPDDWVAVEAPDMSGFRTQRLDLGADSGATFSASEVIVDGSTARWLRDDKIAFVSDGALHIAAAAGSGAHVACDASGIVKPQTEPQ